MLHGCSGWVGLVRVGNQEADSGATAVNVYGSAAGPSQHSGKRAWSGWALHARTGVKLVLQGLGRRSEQKNECGEALKPRRCFSVRYRDPAGRVGSVVLVTTMPSTVAITR